MSTTASLPAPLHIRRGHVVGLSAAVVAVAVVAVATTWAVRASNNTSSAPSKPHQTLQEIVSTITPTGTSAAATRHETPQEIVSTINPRQGYVNDIVAMTPAKLAASFGQLPLAPHRSLQEIVSTMPPAAPVSHSHVGGQGYVAGILSMSPAQLAAAFGNTTGASTLTPAEQDFVQSLSSQPEGASPGFGL